MLTLTQAEASFGLAGNPHHSKSCHFRISVSSGTESLERHNESLVRPEPWAHEEALGATSELDFVVVEALELEYDVMVLEGIGVGQKRVRGPSGHAWHVVALVEP